VRSALTASTITRITGSVPEARTRIRPARPLLLRLVRSLVGQLRSVASPGGDRGLQLTLRNNWGRFGSFDPPIPTNAYQSAVPKPLSVRLSTDHLQLYYSGGREYVLVHHPAFPSLEHFCLNVLIATGVRINLPPCFSQARSKPRLAITVDTIKFPGNCCA